LRFALQLIRAEKLYKSYGTKGKTIEVLNGIDLSIKEGEMVAVSGASGAGKSTFLHIIGALDRPTSGEVLFSNDSIFRQSEKKLASFRNKMIGFIFQFHYLLPEFTALENVMMPVLIGGSSRSVATDRARFLLHEVGLVDRMNHKPGELSGGEQQRVAIARALAQMPSVLLADEPTGNLDTKTGDDIFNLLLKINSDRGTTMIIVTHNERLTGMVPRRLRMIDGRIYEEEEKS